jgi:23S rRNA pseudouridine1911/1915/1917 synthase
MADSYKVGESEQGKRLDIAITTHFGHSRSYWQKQIVHGLVHLNNQPAKPRTAVAVGDVITVLKTKSSLKAPELAVVHNDNDLMIIDKPAGLLVHPTSTSHETTVSDFASKHTTDPDPSRPGIVHRLDRDTSGLLVIAKNPAAKTYLQQLFKSRQVKKTYLALIVGHLKNSEATIDLPIGRSLRNPAKRAVSPIGRKSVTSYRVIREWPGYSLIEVTPTTGRTHQIRVHFSHIGHPIVADALYGTIKNDLGLSRHFLHASKLTFNGSDGKQVTADSNLPADLQSALDRLAAP